MQKILKKGYRVLILSIVFFILGVLFFVFHNSNFFNRYPEGLRLELWPGSGQIKESAPIINPDLPSPGKFKSFSYASGTKNIQVKGFCLDEFYTILIFKAADDYRANPSASRYNTAFPCLGNKEFNQTISLESLNLEKGDYYIIRAHQGKRGSWYNPY